VEFTWISFAKNETPDDPTIRKCSVQMFKVDPEVTMGKKTKIGFEAFRVNSMIMGTMLENGITK
jgi:hypothetical protein